MIITLCGGNSFAVRQALDALVSAFVKKYGSNGIEKIDGETFDTMKLPDLTQGGSLFATNRLIVIRDASKNKQLWDALGEAADKVPNETTIVLVEGTLDKRLTVYKKLKTHSQFKDFSELTEPELLNFIESEVALNNGQIDKQTAKQLLNYVGSDQWRLRQEIAKLCAYDPKVTVESIKEMVEPALEASVFELLDLTLGRQPTKMRALLLRLQTDEDPYKLFGLLVSQISIIALVAHAENRSADEIAKQSGTHPFVVRKTLSLVKSLKPNDVRSFIGLVADTDYRLKSSGHDPWLLLEQTLNKIAAR